MQALRRSDGKHLRTYTVDTSSPLTFKSYPPLDVALYGADYIVVTTIKFSIIFRKDDGVEMRRLDHIDIEACGVIVDVEGRIIVTNQKSVKILE